MKALISSGGIHREGENFFWRCCCHLFDIHSALSGGHKGNAACLAVDQDCEIKFFLNTGAIFDIDPVDQFPGRAGLFGHKCAAQHRLGFFFSFIDRSRQAHATGCAGVSFNKAALPAPTGVDLRFHNPQGTIHFRGCRFGGIGAEYNAPAADRCAVAAQ